MTLAVFLALGNDPATLKNCMVVFPKMTLGGSRPAAARFEGLSESGQAICRYNGRSESDWYLPYFLSPRDVTVVEHDGAPVPYDARPLTG